MQRTYSIGELAEKANTSIRTLRYYDEIGLLSPEKNPETGHRVYGDQDIITLQSIISLKYLGYSLEQIKSIITSQGELRLIDVLTQQEEALQVKKQELDEVLRIIQFMMKLLNEEKEIDTETLLHFIRSLQSEKEVRGWLADRTSATFVEQIFDRPEEQILEFHKEYLKFTKEFKALYGKPVDDPHVEDFIERFMHAFLNYIGEDAVHSLAVLTEEDADELEKISPHMFGVDEDRWFKEAMDSYAKKQEEMYGPNYFLNDTDKHDNGEAGDT